MFDERRGDNALTTASGDRVGLGEEGYAVCGGDGVTHIHTSHHTAHLEFSFESSGE